MHFSVSWIIVAYSTIRIYVVYVQIYETGAWFTCNLYKYNSCIKLLHYGILLECLGVRLEGWFYVFLPLSTQPSVGAVIVDLATKEVIAQAHSDPNHPTRHAVMVCIDNVAKRQGRGSWHNNSERKEKGMCLSYKPTACCITMEHNNRDFQVGWGTKVGIDDHNLWISRLLSCKVLWPAWVTFNSAAVPQHTNLCITL